MEHKGEIIFYKKPDGDISIEVEVKLKEDTLWLSQKLMAKLFDKDVDTIGLHLKNIYSERELKEKATTEDFSVVQNSEEKVMMVKVIVNLINNKN